MHASFLTRLVLWQSVVLHKMAITSQHSTFPIALGIRITGVDDATFSQTGESYSTITLPMANTHTSRTLQEDNTDLAYEFARKFPGYTADNLSEKGIHEVAARRFCLVAADHPLVSAVRIPALPTLSAPPVFLISLTVFAPFSRTRSRRTPRSSRWARSLSCRRG